MARSILSSSNQNWRIFCCGPVVGGCEFSIASEREQKFGVIVQGGGVVLRAWLLLCSFGADFDLGGKE